VEYFGENRLVRKEDEIPPLLEKRGEKQVISISDIRLLNNGCCVKRLM